jgi:hypothetical protein
MKDYFSKDTKSCLIKDKNLCFLILKSFKKAFNEEYSLILLDILKRINTFSLILEGYFLIY